MASDAYDVMSMAKSLGAQKRIEDEWEDYQDKLDSFYESIGNIRFAGEIFDWGNLIFGGGTPRPGKGSSILDWLGYGVKGGLKGLTGLAGGEIVQQLAQLSEFGTVGDIRNIPMPEFDPSTSDAFSEPYLREYGKEERAEKREYSSELDDYLKERVLQNVLTGFKTKGGIGQDVASGRLSSGTKPGDGQWGTPGRGRMFDFLEDWLKGLKKKKGGTGTYTYAPSGYR